jgi:hypothetical protein
VLLEIKKILKEVKQPIEKEHYEPVSDTSTIWLQRSLEFHFSAERSDFRQN